MKKVIVLAAAIALLATPAFAQVIKNSKHNLSSTSGNTYVDDNIDRICVFCHTPHKADTSVVNAPLWNRTQVKTANASDLYNSISLDADSRPSAVIGVLNNSDAPLCLSCHDGASLGDPLVNPITVSGGTQDASFAGSGEIATTAVTNLNDNGTWLTNDHPVGMDYSLADAAGTDFQTETDTTAVGNLRLFDGNMWCSSCHDVHDNQNTPFLAVSNNQSGLCLECHIR